MHCVKLTFACNLSEVNVLPEINIFLRLHVAKDQYFAVFKVKILSLQSHADVKKSKPAFSYFHGILCDTPKKSRGKNLIIVPL